MKLFSDPDKAEPIRLAMNLGLLNTKLGAQGVALITTIVKAAHLIVAQPAQPAYYKLYTAGFNSNYMGTCKHNFARRHTVTKSDVLF